MKESNNKSKRVWRTVVRAALGFALAGFLIYRIIPVTGKTPELSFLEAGKQKLAWLGLELSGCLWPWVLLGVALFGFVILITFYRWQMLLKVQELHLPFRDIVRLGMIGVFFNAVVPGAVGGDVVKMVYVSQHAGKKTAEAVLTILLDRILGLFGLFVVAGIACGLCVRDLLRARALVQGTTALVGLACIGGIIALLSVQYRQQLTRLPGVLKLLELGKRWLPEKLSTMIVRVVAALDLYKYKKKVVMLAILMSVGVHILNALTLYAVGRAVSEFKAAPRHYFLAMQVGNTVGAIPIFPNGIGGRDLVVSRFLEAAGANKNKAVAVPIFFTLVISLWSLMGGVVFVFARFRHPTPAPG